MTLGVMAALALVFVLLGLAGASPGAAQAASTHSADDPTAEGRPLLLFLKLRPNKTRSKAQVAALATSWAVEVQSMTGELDVVDKDSLVATALNHEQALQAKDYFLTQAPVYEVEFNLDRQVFRREGDVPMEELRRALARTASEERRKERWAWLKRTTSPPTEGKPSGKPSGKPIEKTYMKVPKGKRRRRQRPSKLDGGRQEL
mmetsp:Transcript_5923/g.10321  ORF Transcript_5923/g.10321 Transcript_5923/m.10321 type:complete len:203 (-) Transcript_5923:892-1500(-)